MSDFGLSQEESKQGKKFESLSNDLRVPSLNYD